MKKEDSKTTDADKSEDAKAEDAKAEDDKAEDAKAEDDKGSDADKKEDKSEDKDDKSEGDKDKDDKFESYKIELSEDIKADPAMIEGLREFVNKHKIPKDVAEEFAKGMVGIQETSIQTVLDTWETEAKADKEIGGAKFDESVALAGKAVDKFGGPQLKSALEETGLGSHPEIIRMLAKVGKAMSDDKMFTEGNEKPNKKGIAETIYTTMKKE